MRSPSTRPVFAFVLALSACLSSVAEAGISVWPDRATQIVDTLRSGEIQARREAAGELGQLSENLALPGLKIALGDVDKIVRTHAARVVLAYDLRGFAPQVRPWISAGDVEERILAATIMGREPTAEDARLLVEILKDSEVQVRAVAAQSLGRTMGDVRLAACTGLVGALDDASQQVRIEAAASLGQVGTNTVTVALAAHIGDPEPAVRVQVAIALGVIGDPSAVQALLVSTSDLDESVVIAAARALGEIGAIEAVPTLIAVAQKGPFGEANKAALEGLGKIGDLAGLREVARHLELSESREVAARVLLRLGSRAELILRDCMQNAIGIALERCAAFVVHADLAVDMLIAAHNDGRLSGGSILEVAQLAQPSRELEILALEMMGEGEKARAAGLKYLLAMGRSSEASWEILAGALSESGWSAGQIAQILDLLSHCEARRLKEARAIASVYLQASDVRVRVSAVRLLVAQGEEGAALSSLLQDPRAEVASAAAEELSQGMNERQAQTIIRLLVEARMGRRQLLLSTLVALPPRLSEPAVSQLLELLTSARDGDRDALLGAIVRTAPLSVLNDMKSNFDRADWLKLSQLATYHPAGSSLARLALAQTDARIQATALSALGKVGRAEDAKSVVSFTANATNRPSYLRAAAYSALSEMVRRGVAFNLPEAVFSEESCASPHLALRAAALRLSAISKRSCAGAELEHILLLDREVLLRRTAAELLSESTKNSAALRRCSAYEVRVTVAKVCSLEAPSSAKKLKRPGSDAKALPHHEVELRRAGEMKVRMLTPVAVRTEGGVFVFVTDRRGRFIAPETPYEVLEPSFAY